MSLIDLSHLFVSVYCLLNGAEWLFLSITEPIFFSDRDLRMLRLSEKKVIYNIIMRLKILPLFTHKWISIAGSFLLISSGFLLAINSIMHWELPFVCLIALTAQLLYNVMWGTGLEGSDQMATMVLFSLSLLQAFPEAKYVVECVLLIQLILSYVVSGVAKLFSKDWRSGEAFYSVISTNSFGWGYAGFFMRHPSLSRAICIGIIIFEIAWIGLPINPSIAIFFFIAGLIFHLTNAIVMGLNLFPWAFLATYPIAYEIIIFLNKQF